MRIAAALLAPFLIAGAASAQTTTAPAPAAEQAPLMTAPRPDDKATTDPTASQTGVSGSAPSDEMQKTAPSVAYNPRGLTTAEARTLIGKEVRTRDGQTGGAIRDFTLSGTDETVDRVVVESGQGSGAKLVSLPADMLRVDAGGGGAVVDVPQAALSSAPEYTYKDGEKTLVGKP